MADGLLGPLGCVNLFVGPNNAGKSRILRALLREPLSYRESGLNLAELVVHLKAASDAIANVMGVSNITSLPGLSSPRDLEKYCGYKWLDTPKVLDALEKQLAALASIPTAAPRSVVSVGGGRAPPSDDEILRVFRYISGQLAPIQERLARRGRTLGDEPRIYVPVLRGLRQVAQAATVDSYEERTIKDYSLAVDPRRSIFTGQRLYSDLQDLMLGDGAARTSVAEYEEFLRQNFFDGALTELVPRRNDDVVHVRVGDSEHAVHQLGDGIQQIIILTFRAFVEKTESLFFLEEPDMYLHAGMQRKLMELLISHPKLNRHQYFLTTHSNHMIDMAVDYSGVSTFLVRRVERRSKVTVVEGVQRQVLSELGVRASSVFLTNATVWVEGISDRQYLREYLRRYQQSGDSSKVPQFREDAHFSIMEAGGSNLAHFDFSDDAGGLDALADAITVARVCSHSFVVVDGDVEAKRRFKALKDAIGEHSLFVLKGKEVEHLLPIEVVRAYVKEVRPDLDPLKLVPDDYQEVRKPLGKILDDLFGVDSFTDGSSIAKKDNLMKFALDYMRSEKPWTLSADARLLCSKLVEWIGKHNR